MEEFKKYASNEDVTFYSDANFTKEISPEEAARMAAATNYSYSTYTHYVSSSTNVYLKLIRTHCSNIKPVYLNANLASSSYYGINAGFFDGDRLVNFAMYNDVSIHDGGDHNGQGSGVLTWDGSNFEAYHYCQELDNGDADHDLRPKSNYKFLNWAVGGVDLLPGQSDWSTENLQCPNSSGKVGRTGMIGKLSTGYVYLVICPYSDGATAANFRSAMCAYHGISNTGNYNAEWGGLILDGSGSSQMKCAEYSNNGDGRVVKAIVSLINKT